MKSFALNSLAVILALAVHVGAIGLLLFNWQSEEPTVTAKVDKIYFVDAFVAKENPFTAKKNRESKLRAQKRKAKIEAKKNEQIRLNRERLEAEKVRLAAVEKAKLDADKLLDKTDKKPKELQPDSIDQQLKDEAVEAERRALENELQMDLVFEQDARRAVTDDEKALAYVAQIQKEIIQNWSRPPSARNGMQAILKVFLVPTGEVVNVVVQESSGNSAFDRSAVVAVEKADRFIVPTDNRQFEKNFREFEVLFRPEDLRR